MTPTAALHLGTLHGYEQVLVLLLAFGPFVALGVVVVLLRRRDVAAEEAGPAGAGEDPAGPGRS